MYTQVLSYVEVICSSQESRCTIERSEGGSISQTTGKYPLSNSPYCPVFFMPMLTPRARCCWPLSNYLCHLTPNVQFNAGFLKPLPNPTLELAGHEKFRSRTSCCNRWLSSMVPAVVKPGPCLAVLLLKVGAGGVAGGTLMSLWPSQ